MVYEMGLEYFQLLINKTDTGQFVGRDNWT